MSTKIRINVTKEIIERSKYCGTPKGIKNRFSRIKISTNIVDKEVGSNCAVAMAIWDVIPNVWIGRNNITFRTPNCREYITPIPIEATDFITKFDRSTIGLRSNLKPISFEIDVPDEVIDSISIEEITRRLEQQPIKSVELV